MTLESGDSGPSSGQIRDRAAIEVPALGKIATYPAGAYLARPAEQVDRFVYVGRDFLSERRCLRLYDTANRFGVASRSLGILIGVIVLTLPWRAANSALSAVPAATITDDPLEEVVVQGHYELFSDAATGYTNLPLPMEKIPQSIGIVDADLLKAADLKTLADVADYTPGALDVGNPGGFGAFISLRGFDSANALDGINFSAISGANYALDFAVMDRLEIIQGPSSVVYGISSAGGLVNFVTKSAAPATPSYAILQGGSWSTRDPTRPPLV